LKSSCHSGTIGLSAVHANRDVLLTPSLSGCIARIQSIK
jgi:hypothetical protein